MKKKIIDAMSLNRCDRCIRSKTTQENILNEENDNLDEYLHFSLRAAHLSDYSIFIFSEKD